MNTRTMFSCWIVPLFVGLAALHAGVIPEPQKSKAPRVDTESVVAPSVIVDLGGTWESTAVGRGQALATQPAGQFIVPPATAVWTKVRVPGNHAPEFVCWYRRAVDIPREWAGRRVVLRFGRTRCRTQIHWNGEWVHTQIDGSYTYEVDVSGKIRPGEPNVLMVGTAFEDEKGEAPFTAAWVTTMYRGIRMPVSLTVSDPLCVADVFAKPRVAAKALELEVTVDYLNVPSAGPRTVQLAGRIDDDGKRIKTFPPAALTINPGERKVLNLRVDWSDARLWWPHDPYLYRAGVELRERNQGIGGRSVRFGFRELTYHKHRVRVNGKNLFLRRLSDVNWADTWLDGQKGRQRLTQLKAWGYNAFRPHLGTLDYIAELADEEGIFIFPELEIKMPHLQPKTDPVRYDRAIKHVEAAVREGRNHPSIVMWNLCNEVALHDAKGDLGYSEALAALGEIAMRLDPTRLVEYDGDADLRGRAPVMNLHYPWQVWKRECMMPTTIYWLDENKISWYGVPWKKDKPLVIGEYFFPQYCLRFPHGVAEFAGDRAYVDPDGWIEAGLKAYKMINEGFAHAEVFCANPWMVRDEMYEKGPINRSIILALREKHTTFFSGEAVKRTVYVYNHTLMDRKFTAEFRLMDRSKVIYSREVPLTLPGGEMKELNIAIPLPVVSDKLELRVTARLFEGDKEATDGEAMSWSVFPPIHLAGSKIAVLVNEKNLEDELRQAGLVFAVYPSAKDAIASGIKPLLVYNQKIEPADGVRLMEFARNGGNVVLIGIPPGSFLPPGVEMFAGGAHFAAHAYPAVAGHPILDGISPHDVCVWRPDTYVCRQTFVKPDGNPVRTILDAAGYDGLKYAPVVELEVGKGRLILCQMNIPGRLKIEPAAGLLLANLLRAAQRPVETRAALGLKTVPMSLLAQFMQKQKITVANDSPVVLVDGALPGNEFAAALVEVKNQAKTLILHNLTPAHAKSAESLLGVRLALKESKTGRLVRTGRPPLIDGLSNDDFFWMTGELGLSAQAPQPKMTAPVCEYALDEVKSDKGWQLLTQPAALAVYRKEGKTFVLDQIRWDKEVSAEPVKTARIGGTLLANLGVAADLPAPPGKQTCLDLRTVVNRDFSDPIPNDGQGGWTDEGPEWDLRFFPVNRTGIDRHGMPCPKEEFPTRPLRLGRCEFAIINPETNGGKACLVLGRKKGLPSESGRIPVNRTAAALWFLHADDIGWNAADPVPVAAFTVYYRDGSTRDGEMINFNHVGDWRCPDSTFRSGDGYVAWHGYCKAHEPVALYAFQWRNPTPEKPMESITIRVKGNPAYMLVALTAEQ